MRYNSHLIVTFSSCVSKREQSTALVSTQDTTFKDDMPRRPANETSRYSRGMLRQITSLSVNIPAVTLLQCAHAFWATVELQMQTCALFYLMDKEGGPASALTLMPVSTRFATNTSLWPMSRSLSLQAAPSPSFGMPNLKSPALRYVSHRLFAAYFFCKTHHATGRGEYRKAQWTLKQLPHRSPEKCMDRMPALVE